MYYTKINFCLEIRIEIEVLDFSGESSYLYVEKTLNNQNFRIRSHQQGSLLLVLKKGGL